MVPGTEPVGYGQFATANGFLRVLSPGQSVMPVSVHRQRAMIIVCCSASFSQAQAAVEKIRRIHSQPVTVHLGHQPETRAEVRQPHDNGLPNEKARQ